MPASPAASPPDGASSPLDPLDPLDPPDPLEPLEPLADMDPSDPLEPPELEVEGPASLVPAVSSRPQLPSAIALHTSSPMPLDRTKLRMAILRPGDDDNTAGQRP
jgi:hypothetical protein